LDLRSGSVEPLGVYVFDIDVAHARFREQDGIEAAAPIEHALVGKIGAEHRAGGGENETTPETAEHRDLYTASSGAACVFPLRRTSAYTRILARGGLPLDVRFVLGDSLACVLQSLPQFRRQVRL
jgi:hypothetical protein